MLTVYVKYFYYLRRWYRCTYIKGPMVAVEIWEENRNAYFSGSSIIIGRKFGVAVAYSIRIKLAQRKWNTSGYKFGKSKKHLNLLQKHRVLVDVVNTVRYHGSMVSLSGYATLKYLYVNQVSASAEFYKLTNEPVSVLALHSLRK